MKGDSAPPNQTLQQTAAAIGVLESLLSLSAAAAAELQPWAARGDCHKPGGPQ
jgi:hypothetical protein